MNQRVKATKREEWMGLIVNPGDTGIVVGEDDPDRLGRVLVMWNKRPVAASWCNPEMLEEI